MNKRTGLCFGVLALVLGPARLALADTFSYTAINVTGAAGTGAAGINDAGQIVGAYLLPDNTRHGFLLSGGSFSTVDDPNATNGSEALGINNNGQIVGAYDLNPLEDRHSFEGAHGFLDNAGIFTTLTFPGSGITNTTAEKINDSGAVVGTYRMNGPGNGFLFDGTNFSTVDVPATLGFGIHANGINNGGTIVGQYKDNAIAAHHGFIFDGTNFITIIVPGADESWAMDINNSGAIVGFTKTAGVITGFIDNGGVFSPVAPPGAIVTEAVGINNQGDVVGLYVDAANMLHGFEAIHYRPRARPRTGNAGAPGNGPSRRGRFCAASTFGRLNAWRWRS